MLIFLFLTILLNQLQNVLTISCPYYPYYPYQSGSYPAYYTTCSDYCCAGDATSSYAACCAYSTSTYSSVWWISLIVLGIIGVAIVTLVIICVYKKQKKRKLHPTQPFVFQKPETVNNTNYPAAAAAAAAVPEQPPNYDSFMNQAATTDVTTDGTAPMPVLPAPVALENGTTKTQ